MHELNKKKQSKKEHIKTKENTKQSSTTVSICLVLMSYLTEQIKYKIIIKRQRMHRKYTHRPIICVKMTIEMIEIALLILIWNALCAHFAISAFHFLFFFIIIIFHLSLFPFQPFVCLPFFCFICNQMIERTCAWYMLLLYSLYSFVFNQNYYSDKYFLLFFLLIATRICLLITQMMCCSAH